MTTHGTSWIKLPLAAILLGCAWSPSMAVVTPPTIQCTVAEGQAVVGGSTNVVDAGLTVASDLAFTGAMVFITNYQSGDALAFDSAALPTGVTGTWNASTGVLTFNGSAGPAEWQTLLRTIKLTCSNITVVDRTITLTLGNSLPSSDNGHYYEFITSPAITWTAARTAADSMTLFGLQGYLATVTSAAENTFVVSKLAGEGWIGASDLAAESTWRWVTGPEGLEDSGQGRHFTTQTSACSQSPNRFTVYTNHLPGGGIVVGGHYSNWNTTEPNDCFTGLGEHYAHFLTDGTWNDYPNSNGAILGYVVEYGGMPGDPALQISSSRVLKLAHTVTYQAGTGGTISGSASQVVNRGASSAAVTAVPAAGYRFLKWSDYLTTNPRTDASVTANVTVTAQFVAIPAATVTTVDATEITQTSAVAGGSVVDNDEPVTARGLCWATTANPTITGNKTSDGSGAGSFTNSLTGLLPGTTYHIRAYATNAGGTYYGADKTFATTATPDVPDVRLTITAPADTSLVGQDMTFRLDLQNVGTASADQVDVRVPVPATADFVSASLITDSTAQSVPLDATVTEGEVVLTFSNVIAGAQMKVDIVLRSKSAGSIMLTASAITDDTTSQAQAQADASVTVSDVYWEIITTNTPSRLCGLVGIAPAFLLFGLGGIKRFSGKRRK